MNSVVRPETDKSETIQKSNRRKFHCKPKTVFTFLQFYHAMHSGLGAQQIIYCFEIFLWYKVYAMYDFYTGFVFCQALYFIISHGKTNQICIYFILSVLLISKSSPAVHIESQKFGVFATIAQRSCKMQMFFVRLFVCKTDIFLSHGCNYVSEAVRNCFFFSETNIRSFFFLGLLIEHRCSYIAFGDFYLYAANLMMLSPKNQEYTHQIQLQTTIEKSFDKYLALFTF